MYSFWLLETQLCCAREIQKNSQQPIDVASGQLITKKGTQWLLKIHLKHLNLYCSVHSNYLKCCRSWQDTPLCYFLMSTHINSLRKQQFYHICSPDWHWEYCTTACGCKVYYIDVHQITSMTWLILLTSTFKHHVKHHVSQISKDSAQNWDQEKALTFTWAYSYWTVIWGNTMAPASSWIISSL